MIKLYINGKSGKMGTVLNKLISNDNNFSTSVNIDSADVVIDFSHPESTKKVIQESLKKNKPLVIGTTGLNKQILDDINNASKILPIVQAANMSIGIHQLKESLKKFIRNNNKKINCIIEEVHHKKKIDKPSGTALEIVHLIIEEDTNKNINLSDIVSLREDDVSGIHKVTFSQNDVSFIFKHNAISRDIFGNGALHCAKKIFELEPNLYTFEKIID